MTTKDPLAQLLSRAATKLDQMDLGGALDLYQQAIQKAPNNAAAVMGLAMTFNRSGQSSQALPLLHRLWGTAVKLKTKAPVQFKSAVLAQMGLAHQQLGQISEALSMFESAHQLLPSEELQTRIQQLQTLVNQNDPIQQLLLTAQLAARSQDWERAIKTYVAALQLHPDSVDTLHGLATVQRARGASELALPLLQKAVMLAPDRADLFNDLGLVFHDKGELPKAISFHKRALRIDPGHVLALVNLGVAHKRLGQFDEAVAAYQAALKIDPTLAQAHNNLGNLLRIQGQLTEAKTHLKRALALQPEYTDAKQNLLALEAQLRAPSTQVKKPSNASTSTKKVAQPTVAKIASPTPKTGQSVAKKATKGMAPVPLKTAKKTTAKKTSPTKTARTSRKS